MWTASACPNDTWFGHWSYESFILNVIVSDFICDNVCVCVLSSVSDVKKEQQCTACVLESVYLFVVTSA